MSAPAPGHALPAEIPPTSALARSFPPVTGILMASLGLVVVGGIYMATEFPDRPPLGLPTVLLVAGALLTVVALVLTARVSDFAWRRFRVVFGWALLAYVVQAGMIGYAFVHNGAEGAPLVVLIGMLVVFAVDVPFMIAFTSARYATPPASA